MTHDQWRLLRYGLLTALFVLLVFLQILAYSKNFVLLVHVGILDAIVLAIFLLSDHFYREIIRRHVVMKHRKKSK